MASLTRIVFSFTVFSSGCDGSSGATADAGADTDSQTQGADSGSSSGGDEIASSTAASTGDASSGGVVTHECGTFHPDDPGHGIIPDDPADEDIVSACESHCDALLGACPAADEDTCVENCRLTACGVCPGTLVPLLQCKVEHFEASACACDGEPACELPVDCQEQQQATTQCGG